VDKRLRKDIEMRVLEIAGYTLKTHSTVRELSDFFGFCKSTIHYDLTNRLPELNPTLSNKVNSILAKHKAERHINGGNATKQKYALKKRLKKLPVFFYK